MEWPAHLPIVGGGGVTRKISRQSELTRFRRLSRFGYRKTIFDVKKVI